MTKWNWNLFWLGYRDGITLAPIRRWFNNIRADRYYTREGEPIRCCKCGSKRIKTKTISTTNGIPCEVNYYCGSCGEDVGYWAYDSFDPYFREDLL